MADIQHEDIPLGERHAPHDWEYADEAARLAAVITDAKYVGRQALQLDDGSYWRLESTGPAVWIGVAAQGPAGVDGVDGAAGLSAYEVAVVEGFLGDEATWLASLQGEPGTDGSSFSIDAQGLLSDRVNYDSEAENFSYLATDTGDLYIRQTAIAGTWSDPIPFGKGDKGDPGDPGADGADGADGKSAYEVAVFNGFVGDEAAWLLSLKGSDGDAGTDGTNGSDGADGLSAYQIAVNGGFVGDEAAWLLSLKGDTGAAGTDGAAGLSAYEVAVADGFVGDEATWLTSLQGATGTAGADGVDGADGLSAYQIAVNDGFVGDEATWLASLQGADGAQGPAGEAPQFSMVTNPVIVATAGQTVFAIPSGDPDAIVWVLNNGRKLPNDDFTVAIDGLSYTLVEAAAVGEEFQTILFLPFDVANTYTQAEVDALVAGLYSASGGEITGRAYTDPALPTFSATPTFDCSLSNVFEPAAMTANVTAITMSNAVAGQTVQIRFLQDATGGRTVALPSGAKIDGVPNTAANAVNWLVMTYSSRATRWEGNWMQVPA